jgi:hypothetical protein
MHPGFGRAWWCLLGCLVLAAGCSPKRSAEHTDVSGRVLFGGKPLPGGRVTFVTVEEAFASVGRIDDQGNYKIQAPVGEVMISVDNRMLRQNPVGNLAGPRKGAGRPDQPDPDPVTGTYEEIPDKYYVPDTSGLKYTVKPGPQTHDIELKESPD